jgi:hypothetical protein
MMRSTRNALSVFGVFLSALLAPPAAPAQGFMGGVIQASDGNLYGLATASTSPVALLRITLGGVVTPAAILPAAAAPNPDIVVGADGAFCGMRCRRARTTR